MDDDDQDYLKLCMYECLRIEPPVGHSSSLTVTEDCIIGGVKVKKGEAMMLNIHQLHHNQDEWGSDHNTYRPERFLDKKRKPMSFVPFLAGKRICLGKTFAENAFLTVMPILLKAFNQDRKIGRFINPDHYIDKPSNNAILEVRPEIFIRFYPS